MMTQIVRAYLLTRLRWLGAVSALLLTAAATSAQVAASLVAADAAVRPGTPFTVAVHLVHQPHWHTYWVNPGTGLPTEVTWSLPPGWKAGEIQWPAPSVLLDTRGNVIGNGYEGDLLLPVTLTPPKDLAAGTPVVLNAKVDWLMCQDECVPGSAKVSLTLPVTAGPVQPDATFGDRIRQVLAQLPAADPSWSSRAKRSGKTVTLTIEATGSSASRARLPETVHFFSADGYIASDQPQAVVSDGRGGFVLTLPVSPDASAEPKRLVGVVTARPGWREDGSLPGLRVDDAFGARSSTAVALPPPPPPPGGFAGTLALAFIGGLILNLMPCVFPVLGIKILGFVNQAGHDRAKVTVHGLTFTAGVLLSFWILAAVLAALRAGGSHLGWGFQLQSPAFVFGLAATMLVFALNLSGVYEFGLSATGLGSGLQMKSGLMGSFFTGALATVAATPCAAPFLAPALGAALALSVPQSFAIFTVIGLGLSTPYLALSAFPRAVKVLPRPGAWMETFKQAMAFPLYATVAFLAWVLAGQLTANGFLAALFGLVVIALGIWVYGRWHTPGASGGRARFGLIAGLGLLAVGAWTGWPRAAGPTDLVWEKWSPEAVEKLRSENRLVYVDFTARWCATCQANKRLVFGSAEVRKAFRDRHVATLEGDWTNRDSQITAELAKYQRAAVPFNVIWVPGQDQPVVLPELLTPGVVLGALPKS